MHAGPLDTETDPSQWSLDEDTDPEWDYGMSLLSEAKQLPAAKHAGHTWDKKLPQDVQDELGEFAAWFWNREASRSQFPFQMDWVRFVMRDSRFSSYSETAIKDYLTRQKPNDAA